MRPSEYVRVASLAAKAALPICTHSRNTFVVRDGSLVIDALPGRPFRGD